jgi:phospholipid/cholesterol/gamma-HCH transport system substrate-binding protein
MAAARRRRASGRSAFSVGVLALAIVSALVYLGFTKDVPFLGKPFEIQAVFESANSVRPNSPVRIAGVNVGKVARVEPQEGGDGAVVVLAIKDEGLPIHRDATAKIRPRIFLEGNFFVDLKPGSPTEPVLGNGDSIKVTQTATPVQLDEVLTALQEDTRQDLRDVLDGFSRALTEQPTAAQDRRADPDTRGETGAESFNDTYEDAGPSLRSASVFNEALLGVQPDADLARLIDGGAKTTAALARDERALQDLVTNFNRTMAAFAAESGDLQSSIRLLGPTLETANDAFDSLNAAFPATRAFAREILPGVRETPETIRVSFPWIDQTRRLLGEDELRGLARDLSPTTRDFSRLASHLDTILPQSDLLAKCATDVILPTGDVKIQDEFSSDTENYKEFWWTMVGLAGEGANFDGNGPYVRFQPGGGSQTASFGDGSAANTLYGNLQATPIGNRPAYPRAKPPYNTSKPCFENGVPDLNGFAARKGAPDNVVNPSAAPASALKFRKPAPRAPGSAADAPKATVGPASINPFGGGR